MKYLPLLALLLLSCADDPAGPADGVRPGLQSRYTWTRTITSDDPASTPRHDTLSATIEGYLDSYLGRMNVAQVSIRGGITYMVFGEDRRLTTQERVVFPGILTSDPIWLTWPFGAGEVEESLLDTVIGGNRLRASWSARPTGQRRVVLLGEEFDGYDLSYTFIYEVEEEESIRAVEGKATYLPALGWRSNVDETTRLISAGDTVSTTMQSERLVSYIFTPTP